MCIRDSYYIMNLHVTYMFTVYHAFSELFSSLQGKMIKNVSPVEYFKYLLVQKDRRFEKHLWFRFFALDSITHWT